MWRKPGPSSRPFINQLHYGEKKKDITVLTKQDGVFTHETNPASTSNANVWRNIFQTSSPVLCNLTIVHTCVCVCVCGGGATSKQMNHIKRVYKPDVDIKSFVWLVHAGIRFFWSARFTSSIAFIWHKCITELFNPHSGERYICCSTKYVTSGRSIQRSK